jgi:DNA-binding transcriptional LysR family regulator
MDMLHAMKVSRFDFNHAKSLHFLLEEAHVGRAASHLGITAAAASNALRRLREELGDPLLVKKGRGMVRTRVGEELRAAARDVVASTERLIRSARPFDPRTYRGEIPIAMSEHVAGSLLPELDDLARNRSPHATLVIASIPLAVADWLEQSRGALVSPTGAFAATSSGDSLAAETYYEDRYVCVMRRGHPLESRRWAANTYAAQDHVLVTPRGRSQSSDVDEQLKAKGLSRRVVRVVPSFTLALPLVSRSDAITTIPQRCTGRLSSQEFTIRNVPLPLRPLVMKIVVHPGHADDARIKFMKELLRDALKSVDLGPQDKAPVASRDGRIPAGRRGS